MNVTPQVRIDCPCGDERCGGYGAPAKNGHVRRCPCRKCEGRRSRQRGLKKQREARKSVGIPDARYHGQLGNEENWNGPFRTEVKSGKMVGAQAWFLRAEGQSDANRAIGDPRPFMFVAMPKGWGSEGLVTIRLSDWKSHIAPKLRGDR